MNPISWKFSHKTKCKRTLSCFLWVQLWPTVLPHRSLRTSSHPYTSALQSNGLGSSSQSDSLCLAICISRCSWYVPTSE